MYNFSQKSLSHPHLCIYKFTKIIYNFLDKLVNSPVSDFF